MARDRAAVMVDRATHGVLLKLAERTGQPVGETVATAIHLLKGVSAEEQRRVAFEMELDRVRRRYPDQENAQNLAG